MILGAVDRLRLARATVSQLIKTSFIMDVGTTVLLFLQDVTFEKRGFS